MTREEARIRLITKREELMRKYMFEEAEVLTVGIEALQQVTGKLNNPDDSLLTADSEACKEQKSNLDLISRQDAVTEIHKYFAEEIDKTPTEKDEDGDEVYTDMPTVNSLLACNKELSKRVKALPSADRPKGEQYKKGFEDAKRAFLVEYARESQNLRKRNAQLEVMLNAQKAILADRPRGEWIESREQNILMAKRIEKGETWRVCSNCGTGFMIGAQYEGQKSYGKRFHNFCPRCGADMRSEEE